MKKIIDKTREEHLIKMFTVGVASYMYTLEFQITSLIVNKWIVDMHDVTSSRRSGLVTARY